jgi:hypothetical protein
VHEAAVEPVRRTLLNRLVAAETDPRRIALVSQPLDVTLEPIPATAMESVTLRAYEANRMTLAVHAEARALLVLSETYYPGWQASVNGHPARIYEVDGLLRGIPVERGDNQVKLRYEPGSVEVGAVLTLSAFFSAIGFALYSRKSKSAASQPEAKHSLAAGMQAAPCPFT